MSRFTAPVIILFAMSFLGVTSDVLAQEAATSLQSEEKTASKQIQETLSKAVIPVTDALTYLLTKTLPEVEGRQFPLGIRVEPKKPDEPVSKIVFGCPWGPVRCKPFFEACDALHIECGAF